MRKSDIAGSIFFGPYELVVAKRVLLEDGKPVLLGGRAFELLVALTESAGQVVTQAELFDKAWPGISVDEGALRVQISGLRKALGDGKSGARYILTVPGRGYSFVAPTSRDTSAKPRTTAQPTLRLPISFPRIVGRDSVVDELAAKISTTRILTIVGAGGIGKTAVAIAIGHELRHHFGDDVTFLDFTTVHDSTLLPGSICSALGLAQSVDPLPGLIAHLRGRPRLLILDNCEHLIDSVAAIVERIFKETQQTHILATSREAMRVEGECVYHLSPLDCPPDEPLLTFDQIMRYPAAQLLVERAISAGYPFEPTSDEILAVANICRKLDGIALAIELAAGRVQAFGFQLLATLLDTRIELLGKGRRSAAPRHQTLSATLDWSYQLLPEIEKALFRRLSILVGAFTLEAVAAIVGPNADEAPLIDSLAGLVGKSLVVAVPGDGSPQFRLLDTTRTYAWEKQLESGETDGLLRRHASYFLSLLENATSGPKQPDGKFFSSFTHHLANIRIALNRTFSRPDEIELAIRLAAAASHLFMELSLLSECKGWSERAIRALDESLLGTKIELQLLTALGFSSFFTDGNEGSARRSLERALDLATKLHDLDCECALLSRLFIFEERTGNYRKALEHAERFMSTAQTIGDPASIAQARIVLATALTHAGSLSMAREHYEAGLSDFPDAHTQYFGSLNFRLAANNSLARVLWLQGYTDQATTIARKFSRDACAFKNPVSDCVAIVWGVRVFLWNRDLGDVDEPLSSLLKHAERHALVPYQALGCGIKGELLVRRGEIEIGIAHLQEAQERLRRIGYEGQRTLFTLGMAEGLALAGDFDRARHTIEEALALVERNGDLFHKPEILRVKATIGMSLGDARLVEAEQDLLRSRDLAIKQKALAWELRTAITIASLRRRQGRPEDAKSALQPAYQRFTEGFDNADMTEARSILQSI